MRRKICFIINPVSGIGKQKIVEALIKENLSEKEFEIEINYSEAPHHATALSRRAAEANFELVVAVGGDGSVNEVSKGLLHSNTTLAILPSGSGNGLARHLSIPLDLKNALQLLRAGNVTKIDTAQINELHFINVAGIGFDAHIAHLFANYGKRGFMSYIKLVIKEFFQFKEQQFTIYNNGNTLIKSAFLLSIANGSQFGNNATISPQSILNDGYFELCILRKIPVYAIPFFAFQLFRKKANQSKYLEIIKTNEVKIFSGSSQIHIDGEPVLIERDMHVKIYPRALKVVVP